MWRLHILTRFIFETTSQLSELFEQNKIQIFVSLSRTSKDIRCATRI